MIPAAPDPISGQPELKHAPVKLQRYAPAWYGFALSREPLAPAGCSYLVRAEGQGYWRYELAGEQVPVSWSAWSDALLGPREERLEFSDSAGRYRGARVVGDRLQACVFVATTKALPSRTWLASLFADDILAEFVTCRDFGGTFCEAGNGNRADRLLVLLRRTFDVVARNPHADARFGGADREGAAGGHELRVVRAGAQGAARRGRRRLRGCLGRGVASSGDQVPEARPIQWLAVCGGGRMCRCRV